MTEADRIQRLVARFGAASDRVVVGTGDDAAAVRVAGGVTVTSVDAVVDRVHFDLATWPLAAVGHKAVAAALSDIAAMGADLGEVYVAAGIPRSLGEAEFDQLCDGIAAAASGATIAGGDLTSADQLWLSVAVVGYAADENAIVTRDGAKPGDVIVVTGTLGGSARALELIAEGAQHDNLRLQKQFAPQPRFGAGRALAANGATAMIDISDGLARDAGHIGDASGVRLTISLPQIPLDAGIEDAKFAAASGEEYELLATLPAEKLAQARAAVAETGVALTEIGRVEEGAGAELQGTNGEAVAVRGFDHFD
jgi:thiamine-monophosphate kinase